MTASAATTPQKNTRKQSAPITVLVLCTGNSARSIMAEALFNTIGSPLFRASSAGSKPTGRVNPLAQEQIQTLAGSTANYHSKNWREFTHPGSTRFDIILTVCDNAAEDDCPLLNSDAEHIHWGLPDPAAIDGDLAAARRAFAACFATLKTRIERLVATPNSNPLPGAVAAAMRALE